MSLFKTIEEFKLSKKFKYVYFGFLSVMFPIVILIYGIIYFGGLWGPLDRVKNLEVAVVNRDIGCPVESNFLCLVLSSQLPVNQLNIGSNLVDGIKQNENIKDIFDWKYENYTENEAINSVKEYDTWGVMYIPETFTQDVLSQLDLSAYQSKEAQTALITQITTKLKITPEILMSMYDVSALTKQTKPMIKYYYEFARSYTGMTFVSTYLETIDAGLKKAMALKLESTISGKGSFIYEFYEDPYTSKFNDIHPIDKFGENFGTFIMLVLIYIGAISVVFVYRKYRPFDNYITSKNGKWNPFIGVLGKMGINICYMIVTCFFMCIAIVMFGGAQVEHSIVLLFLVLLLWSFLAISFCNLASNLLPLLPFVGISVVFMVIQLATCSGIIAVEFQPGFWSIGKGLPMYYATALVKYILFDTGSRYNTKNLWLLILWIVIVCILDILTSIFELNKVRKTASRQTVSPTKKEPTNIEMEKATSDITETQS